LSSIADTYRAIGITPSLAQLALAKSILGEPLTDEERQVRALCTGRTEDLPPIPFQEATIVCGRKSGKTERIAAPILIHRAVNDDDEPGVYLVVAPSKSDQARVAWQAITRQLERGYPGLIEKIDEGDGSIRLRSGNVLKIQNANFRSLRGPKYKVVVVDEACFFISDDPELGFSNPLAFILDSISGGMVATENPLLLLQSTPWTKAGIVFEQWRDRVATPERLVWQARTLLMNPFANQALMERHRKDRGEAFYNREYLGLFGDEVSAWADAEDIDACVSPQPFFPPRPGAGYAMGLDPGRKRDHFGAAIAHREKDIVVVDWCAEWKPGLFGLKYAKVLPEVFAKAREYKVRKIASDQVDFGGLEASIPLVNGQAEFLMERVMTGGQSGAELSDTTRALFAQRKLVLPNAPGLADEFKRLADYMSQGGSRDVRAKRGFDDRSRAVMLAVFQAWNTKVPVEPWVDIINLLDSPPPGEFKDPYRNLAPGDPGPERWWTPGGGRASFEGPR
jgi:hypothetical protein